MKKVVVLGAGMVGGHIARDLSTAFEVTSVDRSAAALERARAGVHLTTLVADLTDTDALRIADLKPVQ